MSKVYLGLGSNLGDRIDLLNQACELLDAQRGIEVTRRSSVYESKPWGFESENPFANQVIQITAGCNSRRAFKVDAGHRVKTWSNKKRPRRLPGQKGGYRHFRFCGH